MYRIAVWRQLWAGEECKQYKSEEYVQERGAEGMRAGSIVKMRVNRV